jgi:hypothetical protein
MKRIILVLVLALGLSTGMRAQVTIGSTSEPDKSAVLDLNTGGTNNKGLLLPTVKLKDDEDKSIIASPATGLMVYADGTGGLTPAGVYVWNGDKWVSVGEECDTPSALALRPKSLSFGTTAFGDDAPDALSVKAANLGDVDTGELTFGGDMATYYTMTPATLTNIPSLDITQFTVQPNGSLPVGPYSGTISVSNATIEAQTIDVFYEVTKAAQTINGLTAITLPVGGSVDLGGSVSATSGLPVVFSSDYEAVATVEGTVIRAGETGVASISAFQSGDSTYDPATPVSVSVTVIECTDGPFALGTCWVRGSAQTTANKSKSCPSGYTRVSTDTYFAPEFYAYWGSSRDFWRYQGSTGYVQHLSATKWVDSNPDPATCSSLCRQD